MAEQPKTGGPAFPVIVEREDGGVRWTDVEPGMTLRDYFAGQALAAMSGLTVYPQGTNTPEGAAVAAYIYADAMLAAREAARG